MEVDELAKLIAILVVGNEAQKEASRLRFIQLLENIRANDPDVVEYLVQSGLDPNQQLPDQSYPIHHVMQLQRNACAMLVALNSGNVPLKVNVKDGRGKTALHYAVQLLRKDCVDELLKNNADVNLQDNDGNTPLHIAVSLAARDLVRQLAPVTNSIPNNNGQKPDQISDLADVVETFIDRDLDKEGAATKGDLDVSLKWSDYNDLDLHVICPHHTEIYYSHKNAACCKGELDVDMNVGGQSGPHSSKDPVEHIFWKANPPKGSYQVYVKLYRAHTSTVETPFWVRIRHHSKSIFFEKSIVYHNGEKKLVHTFTL